MKDIYDQYAALSRQYSELLNDYQDIRGDTELLEFISDNEVTVFPQYGIYECEHGTTVFLPWRARTKDTMGPPSATVRDAIKSLRHALQKA